METVLDARQRQLCDQSPSDFSDLRAVFVNCTLKRSPEVSHTQGLADLSIAIMRRLGVAVEVIRAVDHAIATGVYPDMTEHGWERDDWPAIYERVMAANILVVTTPIWLGEKSSVCTRVIERLYGNSHLLNDAGQWAYYGRVGGCIVTGNEDGAKHCAMNVLYSLQHLGFVIPPQADAAWLGEAGPGPSYLDPGSGGPAERVHEPEHDLHDLEPAASGAHARRRRRHPGTRQPALGVGRRLPVRVRQPRIPLSGRRPSRHTATTPALRWATPLDGGRAGIARPGYATESRACPQAHDRRGKTAAQGGQSVAIIGAPADVEIDLPAGASASPSPDAADAVIVFVRTSDELAERADPRSPPRARIGWRGSPIRRQASSRPT